MKNRMTLLSGSVFEQGRALPSSWALVQTAAGEPTQQGKTVCFRDRNKTSLAVLALLILIGNPFLGFAKPRLKIENLTSQYSLDKNVDDLDGEAIRMKLLKLLSRPGTKLFLEVIQKAEGGEPNIMVGGCKTKSLKLHPALTLSKRCRYPIRISGRLRFSTASGNYQITFSNWKHLAPFLGLPDFSQTSQALAALELIRRGGGAANAFTPTGLAIKRRVQQGFLALLKGNVSRALCLATYDWASSSCSPLPAAGKIDYAKLVRTVRGRPTRR
ncbi:MAG: hypothetical protein QOH70_679 [Blastocatellia bacterium]|jgi:muramidase (phage lysozyme)|nr:hypothetical protein [Blastocatellia bacterium]